MPAATAEPPEPEKSERDELLFQALKLHIMHERKKKKEELAAELEEQRVRKERELRDQQDATTLSETRDLIQQACSELDEIRTGKHMMYLRLRKYLSEDEIRKRLQERMDSLAKEQGEPKTDQPQQKTDHDAPHPARQEPEQQQHLVQLAQPASQPSEPIGQVFLPPRALHIGQKFDFQVGSSAQPMLISGNVAGSPSASHLVQQQSAGQVKRNRSPSPVQGYWKPSHSIKHEDVKREQQANARGLWNKTTYQNAPTATSYYPGPPDSHGTPTLLYAQYSPALQLRQNYHIEMVPASTVAQQQRSQQPTPPPLHQQQPPPKQHGQPAQVYHIADQASGGHLIVQQQHGKPAGALTDSRGQLLYHVETAPKAQQQHHQQQQQHHVDEAAAKERLPDGMMYSSGGSSMSRGPAVGGHPTVITLPQQQTGQAAKAPGIYPGRPLPPTPQQQIHYQQQQQRHQRY